MTYQEALDQINEWIVTNGNNEITADVLNPVLQAILNAAKDTTGLLEDLATTDQTNLVAAINEVMGMISTTSGVKLYTGQPDPNLTPPITYAYADFYMRVNSVNLPIQLYQFTGLVWEQVSYGGGESGAVSSVNGDTGDVVVDLQSVLDEGSTATSPIRLDLADGGYLEWSPGFGGGGELVVYNVAGDITYSFSEQELFISNPDGSVSLAPIGVLFSQGATSRSISRGDMSTSVQLEFPNATGNKVIPVSVNGEVADASGNIEIETGGDLTGDVTSEDGVSTYNNVVPSDKGGAGTVSGILKANGSGTVSAATANTDYQSPISLTTASTSGAATFSANNINIPRYDTYADAKVADAINDGTTTVAPSQNAVFDALAATVKGNIRVHGASLASLSDNTTYYVGGSNNIIPPTSSRYTVRCPVTSTSVRVNAFLYYTGSAGSSENIQVVLYNLTTATGVTIGNIQSTAFSNHLLVTVSGTFTADDELELRFVVPNMTTNPTGVLLGADIDFF